MSETNFYFDRLMVLYRIKASTIEFLGRNGLLSKELRIKNPRMEIYKGPSILGLIFIS